MRAIESAPVSGVDTRKETVPLRERPERCSWAATGNTDKAAAAYEEIARKFKSAPAAKLATNKLAVLRADPVVAAKYLLEKARAYAARNRPDVALPLLRNIIKRYGKTPSAADAAVLLQRLQKALAAEGAMTPEQVLAARKWLIIGDIAFETMQALKQAGADHWDEEEYYWVADETIATCESAGLHVAYKQISNCGGVFVFEPV